MMMPCKTEMQLKAYTWAMGEVLCRPVPKAFVPPPPPKFDPPDCPNCDEPMELSTAVAEQVGFRG